MRSDSIIPVRKVIDLILAILAFGILFFIDYRGVPKYVRLGEHDLANDDRDRPLQVDIANIVPHPNYSRRYKYYDIALIRMALHVSFNRYMRPACLPESYNTNKEHILASGWGKTYFNQGAAQVLMKVVLEVFTDPECNASYVNEKRLSQLNQGILPEQQFCAGSHREIKDTCGVRVFFFFQFFPPLFTSNCVPFFIFC